MEERNLLQYIEKVLENMPSSWLELTTHRLDIYNEEQAKTDFTNQFEALFKANNTTTTALAALPTAYDYIRLGHPLSCVLEWGIAQNYSLPAAQVISFSSQTMPILAVLRTNLLANKKTQIAYTSALPSFFNEAILRSVYGYDFELVHVANVNDIPTFDGSTIFITQQDALVTTVLPPQVDFLITLYDTLGSILLINGSHNEQYVAAIQHVRRRETIAMTPADCKIALQSLVKQSTVIKQDLDTAANIRIVHDTIKSVTATSGTPLIGSSGLSIQYAIMMGLIDDAIENHKGKAIKFIVPPNCYGGTNDQARRVAAISGNVSIVDLPVDGDNDMVQSIERVLNTLALEDTVPYIIAEIPTNPRVEVPDLIALKTALTKERKTAAGTMAINPVFILDQTFCPNVDFLGENGILNTVRTISYASGSKFPSGGTCTAGYCVGNYKTNTLMEKIALHLTLCDNAATDLQMHLLAQQLPSMNNRIAAAYKNTRDFIDFIETHLPAAKINFVSHELAAQGFTPSVFSLDLPTRGATAQEKEAYKRDLNHKLIELMISRIPNESKYCVSYGQLKGCYWTIPATSTQGTTKESDKDYIARVSVSPDLELDLHKKVFLEFIAGI